MSVKEKIENLQQIVQSELNEKKFVEKGNKLLNSLRNSWQTQKNEFTKSDIQLLSKISLSIDAVQEFNDTLEIFPYLEDKEDVDETIGTLYSVIEKIEGYAVTARVQKEIRELLIKKSNLPSRELREHDLNLSRALNQLNNRNRKCKKCGAKMVIREGNTGYFWGCSTFPNCWGKSRLTNNELSILDN